MKKLISITLASGLLIALSACSSSQTTAEGEKGEAAEAATDAGTDAVPQAAAEVPGDPAGTTDPAATSVAPETATASADAPQDPQLSPSPSPVAEPAPAQAALAPAPVAEAGGVTPSPAGNGQFQNYTVQAGDSLMKIAFETYGDLYRWKSILDANKDKVTDPNRIPAGTVLKLETPSTGMAVERNGEKYLIKNGDTLGTISGDVYGTPAKWKRLWENNKQLIHDPNRIFAGFYLYYQSEAAAPVQADSSTAPAPMANAAAPADASRTPASGAAANPVNPTNAAMTLPPADVDVEVPVSVPAPPSQR